MIEKNNSINEIWKERRKAMDAFHDQTMTLLLMCMPIHVKIGLFQKAFDSFVLASFDQDSRIRTILDQDWKKYNSPLIPIEYFTTLQKSHKFRS